MTSIRNHMTSSLLIGQFIILVCCGSALYFYVQHILVLRFDDGLLATARTFAAMSEHEDDDSDDSGREKTWTVQELPEAVQNTITRHAGESRITEIDTVEHDGQRVYRVEAIGNGLENEFSVSEDGDLIVHNGEFNFEFSEVNLPEFQPSPQAEYYQVWEEDGEVVSRSPSLEGSDLHCPSALELDHQTFDTRLPDGRKGRAVSLPFESRVDAWGDFAGERGNSDASGERLIVVIARSREAIDRDLEILLTGLLLVGTILVTCTVLLVRWTVARGLQPLDAVAQQARNIDAGTLSGRFPTESLPRELLPISQRLNELLQRLEDAFLREKRFTSDVAHELRTPIAELRALTEVGLRSTNYGFEPEELTLYFQDALAIATQMERLCTTLLDLARCASNQQHVECSQVDIVAIVMETWRAFEETAQNSHLVVNFDLPVSAVLETDRALLTAIVSNLLSNAVTYTPSGGRVSIIVTDGNKKPLLRITNDNDQLTNDDLTPIFEPFWRKDSSRTDSSHIGVGLSVIAAFSELLDLDVSVALPSPDQFSASITQRHV